MYGGPPRDRRDDRDEHGGDASEGPGSLNVCGGSPPQYGGAPFAIPAMHVESSRMYRAHGGRDRENTAMVREDGGAIAAKTAMSTERCSLDRYDPRSPALYTAIFVEDPAIVAK
jgi:hypothetical protein